MSRIIIVLECLLLLVWILIERVYTKGMLLYSILFGIYLFIFLKFAPRKITGIRNILIFFVLIFANLFILSLIFMELSDYFYNNKDAVSTFRLSYRALFWYGYNISYISIIGFLLGLFLLPFVGKAKETGR